MFPFDSSSASLALIMEQRQSELGDWQLLPDSTGVLRALLFALLWEAVFRAMALLGRRYVRPKDVEREYFIDVLLPSYGTSTVHATFLCGCAGSAVDPLQIHKAVRPSPHIVALHTHCGTVLHASTLV